MSQDEPRCPRCGALVTPDAEWCGQCLEPLGAGSSASATSEAYAGSGSSADAVEPEVGATRRSGDVPTWTCPVCEQVNPIETDPCGVCGTPFARLFAEQEQRVEISPAQAGGWSLLLPGLGHWKAGRHLDWIARMVLYVWTLGTVGVLLVSAGEGGLGSGTSLLLLFLAAAVGLYVTSVVDARRVAAGDEPLVSSRTLLWSAVGLVVISVLIATVLALPAARGR